MTAAVEASLSAWSLGAEGAPLLGWGGCGGGVHMHALAATASQKVRGGPCVLLGSAQPHVVRDGTPATTTRTLEVLLGRGHSQKHRVCPGAGGLCVYLLLMCGCVYIPLGYPSARQAPCPLVPPPFLTYQLLLCCPACHQSPRGWTVESKRTASRPRSITSWDTVDHKLFVLCPWNI